jgi:hypothetical protein
MKYQNSRSSGNKVKHPKLPIFAAEPKFRNPARYSWHRPREWHPRLFALLQKKKNLSQMISDPRWKCPDHITRPWMKYNPLHKASVSKAGHCPVVAWLAENQTPHPPPTTA